jgi:hypothetical protein
MDHKYVGGRVMSEWWSDLKVGDVIKALSDEDDLPYGRITAMHGSIWADYGSEENRIYAAWYKTLDGALHDEDTRVSHDLIEKYEFVEPEPDCPRCEKGFIEGDDYLCRECRYGL